MGSAVSHTGQDPRPGWVYQDPRLVELKLHVPKLEKQMTEINPNLEILSLICDTTKPQAVKDLADKVKQKWNGRLDVAIANAGVISNYLYDTDSKTGEKTNRRLPKGIIEDDDFMRLMTFPNVIVTGHQAFFTQEALAEIANTTLSNLEDWLAERECKNALVAGGNAHVRRDSHPVRI